MNRKHVALSVSVLVVLLFLVNLLVGGGPTAMVNTARAQREFADVSAAHMKVLRYECDNGVFGFGGHGVVDFGPDAKNPSRVLRVTLSKSVNLLGWHVDNAVWHIP